MDAAGVCVETLGAGNRRRIPHGNGNRNGRGMLGNWSGLKMFWVASTVVAVTSEGPSVYIALQSSKRRLCF